VQTAANLIHWEQRNDKRAEQIRGEIMSSGQHDDSPTRLKALNKKKQGHSRATRQLNVWIKKETRAALAQQAKLEQRSMTAIIEDLIQHYTGQEQAELVERQGLPLIREVIVTEIRKALAQHRLALSEDMQVVILDAVELYIRQSVEQLTRTIRPAVRLGTINRHLIYALISHSYGEEVAMQEDDAASGKIGKATPLRSPAKEG